MILPIIINNVPTEPEKGNPWKVYEAIVNKAVLTKAMWFIVLLDLVFILAVIFIPQSLYTDLGLTTTDKRVAFWIFISMNVLLGISYAVAEIVINFVHGRGFKE